MKRFEFSLEQALNWRRLRAEVERAKLEQLFAELRHLDLRKQALDQEGLIAQNEVRNQEVVRATQLVALDSFTRHWNKRALNLAARRVEIFKEVAEQQTRLIGAQRDYDLLLKVKARKLSEWQVEFNREQEELASEVFLAKWSASQRDE
jgi:capsule polysaccharide export protein KpsE/RkpR